MQAQGPQGQPVNETGDAMRATDDEIAEKYLERAIRELNALTRELQACPHCPRGSLMPVLGSGHPQADVMLLKHAPVPSVIEEGVAFYGRTRRWPSPAASPASSRRSRSCSRRSWS